MTDMTLKILTFIIYALLIAAATVLVCAMVGCGDEGTIQQPATPIDFVAGAPELIVEPEESDEFQASWEWISRDFIATDKYRVFISLSSGMGPSVTFSHFRDINTFTDIGAESLLHVKYQDFGERKYLKEDFSGWNLPWYTRISYDPSKIEILNETQEAPPFVWIHERCGWLSDYHFSHIRQGGTSEIIVRELPDRNSDEFRNYFERVYKEVAINGKMVEVKRTNAAEIPIRYRYLGGGDAYIFIWTNDRDNSIGSFVGIKVTSENL